MAPTAAGFCQDCFKGTLRGDVTPTGTVETIHGLPTYVARPDDPGKEPLGLVVIVPDAFGWELLNTRALADAYARRGPFLVYLPDFMNGAAPPASDLALMDRLESPSPDWWTTLVLKPYWVATVVWHFLPFVIRIRAAVSRPVIRSFFAAIRDSAATSPPPELAGRAGGFKVGVVGFCWGGRYAFELCGEQAPGEGEGQGQGQGQGRELVHCGFTAHPAQVGIPADVERVHVPISVANGEDDLWMGREKMATLTRILEGKRGSSAAGSPSPHEVVVYEGATHGFAIRGDPNDPKQAEHGLRAEDQAVAWFRRQFSSEL